MKPKFRLPRLAVWHALRHMKLHTKLVLGLSVLTLFVVLMGLASAAVMTRFKGQWEQYQLVASQKKDAVNKSYVHLGDAIRNFKNMVIRGENYDESFATDVDAITRLMAQYRELEPPSDEETQLLQAVDEAVAKYRKVMAEVAESKRKGDKLEDVDDIGYDGDKPLAQALSRLLEHTATANIARTAHIQGLVDMASKGLLAAVVLGALVAGGIAFTLARTISRSLQESVAIAERVASGDLSARIEVTRSDEFGQLMGALGRMNANLAHIVGEVRDSTDSIASYSTSLANGNMDLSRRTETQASALEETASSLTHFTESARENAAHARSASELAQQATQAAVKGGSVVEQAVATMKLVDQSSNKIADITSVIDSIAFQTNILALNAAVEAARAGEQGRGFAVVASEVRVLAQRSAAAAKEIKELINDSVGRVAAGSRYVNETGASMQEIVSSIQAVSEIIGRIASASGQQSEGIARVHDSVARMSDLTQQNAALAEEAAATTETLQGLSARLSSTVSALKGQAA